MPSLPAKEERGTTPERSGKVQKSNKPPLFYGSSPYVSNDLSADQMWDRRTY
jgi:hypothetical protein